MNSAREMNTSFSSSRKMNSGFHFTKDNQKKYCGVCFKAGKSASEYESHFTKSTPGPKGIVTCPMIIMSQCKCCGKSGHFTDHCPNKKSSGNGFIRPAAAPTRVSVRRSENRFDILESFDFDNNVVNVKRTNVDLSSAAPQEDVKRMKLSEKEDIESRAPNGISFASILMKPAPVPVQETSFKISPTLQNIIDSEKSDKLLLAEKIISERSKRCSWLDSDSDDEDDYETAW